VAYRFVSTLENKRSTLVVFVVLAYGISWIVWAPVILLFRDATAPPSWALLLAFVGVYGPSIAAVVTSLTYGESDGLVSLFRTAAGHASWRWYLLVTLGPPAFVWYAAGIQALEGGQISMAGVPAPAKMMVVLGPSFLSVRWERNSVGAVMHYHAWKRLFRRCLAA
jgi:4-hydroxybenzoate polyprenyltransferase